ncbi:transglycosylase domain-containing protein [Cytophagaceae bacterium YF14B1]|uniref:Transglycosylase domain-containing protein n=1 Tax=Xanthocytophaga flava TaxID=3048013 RepID=A0AAE3QUM6_9BACT|nr:transglycosylase domain-containing protein [Xanthocytophaga flavus]MDJ1483565.1 transglycosylase domain-containing protein [Xanthocytophaga flavus]
MQIQIEKGKYYKWVVRLWIFFLAGFFLFLLYLWAVSSNLFGLFGELPSFKSIENPKSSLASVVYAIDGTTLGSYYREENRNSVDYNQLSPNIIHALVATEDVRFEQHSGIDFIGVSAIVPYLAIGKRRGSSTLTQQVARNLFPLRREEMQGAINNIVIDKTKEWLTAIQLERSYTKEEILTMYLNTVDFGSRAFGIESASRTFFQTTASKLTIPQAAMLVGMVNNPSFFSPVRHPERALRKRNFVLSKIAEHGFITEAQLAKFAAEPLNLKFRPENSTRGLATYFRAELEKELRQIARKHDKDLYTDGLRIYTTIDSRLQRYAEEAVTEQMKKQQAKFFAYWKKRNPWTTPGGAEIKNYVENIASRMPRFQQLLDYYNGNEDSVWAELRTPVRMSVFSWEGDKDTVMSSLDSIAYHKKFLQTGLLAIEPSTGQVRAWVGGIDFRHFQYDHVRQGKRQPGSTFKPILYAAAIDNAGYKPCDREWDRTITIDGWTADNYSRTFSDSLVTLRNALARSLNTIPARLTQKVGASMIVEYAKRLGIKSPLKPYPALCLGTESVSMYELLSAYATFPAAGVWHKPQYLVRIEDRNGNVLEEFHPQEQEVIGEETAYLMTYMLRGGVEEQGGSAQAIRQYKFSHGNEVGAKTGTTQNYADGWTVGITQDLAAAVWFGGDDMNIHFRDGSGAGSKTALPIFATFMEKAFSDPSVGLQKKPFTKPRVLNTELDCQKYTEALHQVDSTQYPVNTATPDSLLDPSLR